MELKNILDIIQALSVISASFVTVCGISSWRRETKWKRKYELAEEVLSCFYDISERFNSIRNPVSFEGEGKTRERNENESENESKILDRAHIIFERYEKEKEAFVKLKSLKYRFMVLYGKQAGVLFDEVILLKNKLFLASHMLGHEYWKNKGSCDFSETERDEMHEQEAVFWAGIRDDKFKKEVDMVILKAENICEKIIKKR